MEDGICMYNNNCKKGGCKSLQLRSTRPVEKRISIILRNVGVLETNKYF